MARKAKLFREKSKTWIIFGKKLSKKDQAHTYRTLTTLRKDKQAGILYIKDVDAIMANDETGSRDKKNSASSC